MCPQGVHSIAIWTSGQYINRLEHLNTQIEVKTFKAAGLDGKVIHGCGSCALH